MSCTLNSWPTNVAVHREASIGAAPVDAPAWVTSEGAGTAHRFFVETLDPAFILGNAAIANADMTRALGEHLLPHQGLPTADGGSMLSRLWSTGQDWVTGDPVTETPLGWLLEQALGGSSLGNHATITVVNSPTSFDLDDVADLAVGQVIAFDQLANLGNSLPARILTIAGSTVTIDRSMPAAVVGDPVYGAETNYYDPDAIGDTTLSLLLAKNTDVWMLGGGKFGLDTITTERGEQPKLNWSIFGAKAYPPGAPGAITLPAFVNDPEGRPDVSAIGANTHVRLVEYGDTAVGEYTVHAMGVEVGVPIVPRDTVTESSSGSPGRECYGTERGETVITLSVKLLPGEQQRWTERQEVAVTIAQSAAAGFGWCIDGVRGFMMMAPTPQTDGQNLWEMKIQLTDDMDKATQLARAKFVIARY